MRYKFSLKQATYSGLLAGLIFLVLEMIMVPLFLGGSAWGPPRLIGAILLGRDVLPPPATFNFGVVLAAVILHLALSVIYAIAIAAIVQRMSVTSAIIVGAIGGLVLYLVNFYLFTGWFEWMIAARTWVNIFAHISYGIAVGWAYRGGLNIRNKKIHDQAKREDSLEERRRKQARKHQEERLENQRKEPYIEEVSKEKRIREEKR
ncbi:MAG: hypothetical protein ACOCUV_00655 [bacterium]